MVSDKGDPVALLDMHRVAESTQSATLYDNFLATNQIDRPFPWPTPLWSVEGEMRLK